VGRKKGKVIGAEETLKKTNTYKQNYQNVTEYEDLKTDEYTQKVVKREIDYSEVKDLHDVIKIQKDTLLSDVDIAIKEGMKKYEGSFFVVFTSITTKDNKQQNIFTVRDTCPQPDYDQAVFFYDRVKQEKELWWTIPIKEVTQFLNKNRTTVSPEHYPILDQVIKFYNREFGDKAFNYNKENF